MAMVINKKGYWECQECGARALMHGYHKPDCPVVIQEQKEVCSRCQFHVGWNQAKGWCYMFGSMFIGCQKFVKTVEESMNKSRFIESITINIGIFMIVTLVLIGIVGTMVL